MGALAAAELLRRSARVHVYGGLRAARDASVARVRRMVRWSIGICGALFLGIDRGGDGLPYGHCRHLDWCHGALHDAYLSLPVIDALPLFLVSIAPCGRAYSSSRRWSASPASSPPALRDALMRWIVLFGIALLRVVASRATSPKAPPPTRPTRGSGTRTTARAARSTCSCRSGSAPSSTPALRLLVRSVETDARPPQPPPPAPHHLHHLHRLRSADQVHQVWDDPVAPARPRRGGRRARGLGNGAFATARRATGGGRAVALKAIKWVPDGARRRMPGELGRRQGVACVEVECEAAPSAPPRQQAPARARLHGADDGDAARHCRRALRAGSSLRSSGAASGRRATRSARRRCRRCCGRARRSRTSRLRRRTSSLRPPTSTATSSPRTC